MSGAAMNQPRLSAGSSKRRTMLFPEAVFAPWKAKRTGAGVRGS
jgi:hypothetical protein